MFPWLCDRVEKDLKELKGRLVVPLSVRLQIAHFTGPASQDVEG